jgi:predicted site-specific integrase-resolvase
MPVNINGDTYYRTAEVFHMLGISRNTLFRWLQKDILRGIEHRDSRGWRLFTREDVNDLNTAINSITSIERQISKDTEYSRKNA